MSLPYRIATLIYAFNEDDQVLLLKRSKPPNLGLWSPPGGKLMTATGESPHMCAARETREELGINASPTEFHLTGIVSEHGYDGSAHWLMFLFEFRKKLESLPEPIEEGVFTFFSRSEISKLQIPKTDREQIWPLFWQHRGGSFVAHCHCHEARDEWTLEQSKPRNPTSKHSS